MLVGSGRHDGRGTCASQRLQERTGLMAGQSVSRLPGHTREVHRYISQRNEPCRLPITTPFLFYFHTFKVDFAAIIFLFKIHTVFFLSSIRIDFFRQSNPYFLDL